MSRPSAQRPSGCATCGRPPYPPASSLTNHSGGPLAATTRLGVVTQTRVPRAATCAQLHLSSFTVLGLVGRHAQAPLTRCFVQSAAAEPLLPTRNGGYRLRWHSREGPLEPPPWNPSCHRLAPSERTASSSPSDARRDAAQVRSASPRCHFSSVPLGRTFWRQACWPKRKIFSVLRDDDSQQLPPVASGWYVWLLRMRRRHDHTWTEATTTTTCSPTQFAACAPHSTRVL